MKIDIVTDTFSPDVNGVAMTLGRLTDGLRERGHRVHVIRTGGISGHRETLAHSLPIPGYKEVRMGLPEPFKLRKRWLKKRPDAIYVATESPLGRSAVKAAEALGIPVATGFHTNFHGYLDPYRLGKLQPAAKAYLKRFHLAADCTLAPSPELVDRLRDEGFRKVHLLGRGVDSVLFSPDRRSESLRATWDARPGVPVVIMVGRLAAEKNLDLAMISFMEMRKVVPDAKCIVVGDGPLREKMEERYKFARFAGMKTGEDLAAYYASADILLFPSATETFGNVLVEGMASGLITVSYAYAASERYVKHGVNGYHAARGDSLGFIHSSVEALACRPDMKMAARQTAVSLGWDQIVKDFANHLENLPTSGRSVAPTRVKRDKLRCRTVFLSDIHLGMADSKALEVVHFLKHIKCDKLILNGDIIDGWALRRGGRWLGRHSRVIRKILKMIEKDKTEVIYLRGNHDDILERFLPLAFGRLKIAKEHIHVSAAGVRYLVVHGDGFDSVSTKHKWLASLGAVGYDTLIKVNRVYNNWRAWRGKEYFSISKRVKAKVKSAVGFVNRYEDLLQELARFKKCDGIICGHIHTPDDKHVGQIHYLNSGDWVESLTAVIEHRDGRMELVRYADFFNARINEDEATVC